jgi:hypothetical protein
MAASILALAIVGCSNTQPVQSVPTVTGVPLASFMAFRVDPGLLEVPSGGTISANKWVIVVPRFINGSNSTSDAHPDDWVVLPLALDSQDLCEKEASMLTERVEVEVGNSIVTPDGSANGTALKSGSIARCVLSDGSSKFVANSTAL